MRTADLQRIIYCSPGKSRLAAGHHAREAFANLHGFELIHQVMEARMPGNKVRGFIVDDPLLEPLVISLELRRSLDRYLQGNPYAS